MPGHAPPRRAARWIAGFVLGLGAVASSQLLAQTAPTPAAPPVAEPAPPQRGGEPQVRRIVLEDDQTRIEELRVRGQTQTLTVESRFGGAVSRYQIVSGTPPSDRAEDRRATGRSVWTLFAF
ncbi:MAG: hypothetical protein MUF03_12650 [Rubrivivax sp.]|nr:hypothetical protein [Rubrivivax sp.]